MAARLTRTAVQHYKWGKPDGLISRIQAANSTAQPCAELWMGTHVNGHSEVENGRLLKDFLGYDLPFLFKVLNVNTALSIQAHPTKAHAEALHAERPTVYKDPNHKPELAVAITRFECLSGFRSTSAISGFFDSNPELIELVSPKTLTRFRTASALSTEERKEAHDTDVKGALKELFTEIMNLAPEKFQPILERLRSRVAAKRQESQESLSFDEEVFLRLNEQYPGDIGCFAPFLMNVLALEPGESMYVDPNFIHAYLSGDCYECMACSDNVVRAGLTPKYRDVSTLCSMLDYRSGPPAMLKPKAVDEFTRAFCPPIDDFGFTLTNLPAGRIHELHVLDSASIIFVGEGSGTLECDGKSEELKLGDAFVLQPNAQVSITAADDTIIARSFSPSA